MRRVSYGYTLIEVLIFLVVSTVMFLSAVLVMSGREDSARFTQSMRDVQSKFQDWINDVSTGNPGTTRDLTRCFVTGSGSSKQLHINNVVVGSPAPSPDCIFLGKAIQVTTGAWGDVENRRIYAYPVFASRLNNSGNLVSGLTDGAAPTPAVGSTGGSGTAELTEVFNLGGSTKVLNAQSQPDIWAGTYPEQIVGFYNSFNTQQNTAYNGAKNIFAYAYNYVNPADYSSHRSVYQCITDTGPFRCYPGSSALLTSWDICFGNDNNNQTAKLTIASSAGNSPKVSLAFTPCT